MATDLTRPIVGIENRTAQEVFDIMCDRLRAASPAPAGVTVPEEITSRYWNMIPASVGIACAPDPGTEQCHLRWMLQQLRGPMEHGKAMRWLGFVQGVLICTGYTTVAAERDFTRPYFAAPSPAAPADGLVEPVAWCDTLDSCLETFWCLTEAGSDNRLLADGAIDAARHIRTALASAEARADRLEKERDALEQNTQSLLEIIEVWKSRAAELEAGLETAIERAFRDGLTYASNVVVTDPDEAWRQYQRKSGGTGHE